MTLLPSHTCSAQSKRPCKAPTIRLSNCVHSCFCCSCTANLQALPRQATAYSQHCRCVPHAYACLPTSYQATISLTFNAPTSIAWYLTAGRWFKIRLYMCLKCCGQCILHASEYLFKVKRPGSNLQQAVMSDFQNEPGVPVRLITVIHTHELPGCRTLQTLCNPPSRNSTVATISSLYLHLLTTSPQVSAN